MLYICIIRKRLLYLPLHHPFLRLFNITKYIISKKMAFNKCLFSSSSDMWSTPQSVFDELNAEFFFTLDPCASSTNAKCSKYYTELDNGLLQDWSGESVFCNPPYGRALYNWIEKCSNESQKPNTTVVALIPSRTDTRWFHEFIYHRVKEIRFLKGRLKFGNAHTAAPFPSMVVVF